MEINSQLMLSQIDYPTSQTEEKKSTSGLKNLFAKVILSIDHLKKLFHFK